MKTNKLIEELQFISEKYGNIPVNFQVCKSDVAEEYSIVSHESFFVVDEQYDTGWEVNIRTWPY